MTSPLPFNDAFESELLKMAVAYPKKRQKFPPLSISEARAVGTRKPQSSLSLSQQLAQRPRPRPPGMFYNPPKGYTSKKPTSKPGRKMKMKGRARGKAGTGRITTGGSRWNVRNPTKEHFAKLRAAQARKRTLRGTDLSEETTISGAQS